MKLRLLIHLGMIQYLSANGSFVKINFMKNKRILITGGMGLIGPAVIKRLMKENSLVVVDRLDYGIAPNYPNLLILVLSLLKKI